MSYAVQTTVFEGPLDLLLHLILKEQVDLYELSLSALVDAYIAELDRMDTLDLDVATEFLLVAATLVELKSRRLLPGRSDIDLDDELMLFEERDLLLARLLECKTFKDAADALWRHMQGAARSHPRIAGPEEHFLELAPDLLEGVTATQLAEAFRRATTPRPVPHVDLDHVAPVRASVSDAVDELCALLPHQGPTTFRQLTQGISERLEVIVRFLALLELYKQGRVDLTQTDTFGTLGVVWTTGADDALETIDAYEG
jgi:segregation and condensation protein A